MFKNSITQMALFFIAINTYLDFRRCYDAEHPKEVFPRGLWVREIPDTWKNKMDTRFLGYDIMQKRNTILKLETLL